MRGDKMHGSGKLAFNSRSCLIALPNGHFAGAIDGCEYDGVFVDGVREGHGKLRFKGTDFKTYDGLWAKDIMVGMGKLTWRDGSSYTGMFKEGLMWGAGELEKFDETGSVM
jgi:hypothetical protein